MAQTVCVIVSASDGRWLEAIKSDRNGLQKHTERAREVLASAQGDSVQCVAALLGGKRLDATTLVFAGRGNRLLTTVTR